MLVVHDAQALVADRDGRLELVLVPPAEAPAGTRLLLGVDDDDVAYFGVSTVVPGEATRRTPRMSRVAEHDAKPMALRQVGALLSDRDAGLMTHAVALANWHDSHTHCPQCGTPHRAGARPGT